METAKLMRAESCLKYPDDLTDGMLIKVSASDSFLSSRLLYSFAEAQPTVREGVSMLSDIARAFFFVFSFSF